MYDKMSCIPWLAKMYSGDCGDRGNIDSDSDSDSVKSCPSQDSEEERRRSRRWVRRGPVPSVPSVPHGS